MKMMRVFAALVAGAAMLFAPALMAQEAPATPKSDDKPAEKPKDAEKAPEGDKKEEPKEGESKPATDGEKIVLLFKDLDQVTGKVSFGDGDVGLFIKHFAALEKLFSEDEKMNQLSGKSIKEAYDYLVKNEKYKEWAKGNSLDAESFLKKSYRLYTDLIKQRGLESVKLAEAQHDEQRKELEATKADLSTDDYKSKLAEFDAQRKDLALMKKALNDIPGPTEVEAKLLEANKKEIAKAMGEEVVEDDADDDEKEDGMGSK